MEAHSQSAPSADILGKPTDKVKRVGGRGYTVQCRLSRNKRKVSCDKLA